MKVQVPAWALAMCTGEEAGLTLVPEASSMSNIPAGFIFAMFIPPIVISFVDSLLMFVRYGVVLTLLIRLLFRPLLSGPLFEWLALVPLVPWSCRSGQNAQNGKYA